MTNETPKAAQAFHEYCLLEDRSLAKLASSWKLSNNKPASNLRQLAEWSRLHDWSERVKQYDLERAQEKQRKKDDAIQQMNERHAMIGTTHQVKAIKQIEALIKIEKFGSQAVVQLLKLAIDVERDARGVNVKKLELTGKDGGPVETEHTQVVFYVPKVRPLEEDA